MTTYKNQRELLREKRKADKRRSVSISVLIIVGVIVIFGSITLLSRFLAKPVDYETSQGFMVGDPNAPVEVVAFSNYSCGYCKIFSETIEKDFISDFAETGKVNYRYVNLASSNESSINAAEASYCAAEQNKFFEYKDYLYTYAAAADGFTLENFNKYAKSAGLDTESFEICMIEGDYDQAYLNDRAYAQSAGINATPTFLVNGQIVSASELVTTVEELLGN
jgi:protein-disulfide isomerase